MNYLNGNINIIALFISQRNLYLYNVGSSSSSVDTNKSPEAAHSATLKKLEQQYESSRYLTHVARGVGLGFNSISDSNDLNH